MPRSELVKISWDELIDNNSESKSVLDQYVKTPLKISKLERTTFGDPDGWLLYRYDRLWECRDSWYLGSKIPCRTFFIVSTYIYRRTKFIQIGHKVIKEDSYLDGYLSSFARNGGAYECYNEPEWYMVNTPSYPLCPICNKGDFRSFSARDLKGEYYFIMVMGDNLITKEYYHLKLIGHFIPLKRDKTQTNPLKYT